MVLYGCKTWSLTLREARKLTVIENTVLGMICGPERDEVTGEWSKIHKEELNDLYSLSKIIRVIKLRRMRWRGMWHALGRGDVCTGFWCANLRERERLLGKHRSRWEDNIKMYLQEVGCGGMDWIELAQDRDRWRALVSAVMNIRVP